MCLQNSKWHKVSVLYGSLERQFYSHRTYRLQYQQQAVVPVKKTLKCIINHTYRRKLKANKSLPEMCRFICMAKVSAVINIRSLLSETLPSHCYHHHLIAITIISLTSPSSHWYHHHLTAITLVTIFIAMTIYTFVTHLQFFALLKDTGHANDALIRPTYCHIHHHYCHNHQQQKQ